MSLHYELYLFIFCLILKQAMTKYQHEDNTSQLIDQSITNGAKLINLPPESPLFGRSDKLVRDPIETKEPGASFIKAFRTYFVLKCYRTNFLFHHTLKRLEVPTFCPKLRTKKKSASYHGSLSQMYVIHPFALVHAHRWWTGASLKKKSDMVCNV